IDGANLQRSIFKIVLPLIKPVIFLSAVLNFIGGFRVYDIIWAMTRGGPVHASEVLTTYMYYQSFQSQGPSNMGYAATIAVTLAIIVLVFAVIRIKFLTREE
ncbi:MAG: sugar ABC transporter permease, partial [Actinomycetia bacterium]|nr:sugar ABC transporter permease [Actinomycetes bacterium]